MTRQRETSAETAARFLALRSGQVPAGPRRGVPSADSLAAERLVRWMGAVDQLAATAPTGRVLIDLAMPTLRLIHEVLLDAIRTGLDFSNRGALLLIAEQMVATALGMPPCDDPPLTDRSPHAG